MSEQDFLQEAISEFSAAMDALERRAVDDEMAESVRIFGS